MSETRAGDGIDVYASNRAAWDRAVEKGNRWTRPVGPAEVAAARRGELELLLTPTRPIPMAWLPPFEGLEVLCLASGGGQQAPLLAAAGARVTVLDASPRQLEQDRMVADREGLELRLLEGDMADIGPLADSSFDLVLNPVSTCFVPEVRPVWSEAFRVLRQGGLLLAGLANPVLYLFDDDPELGCPDLLVTHRIPYSDLESLTPERHRTYLEQGLPFEFGHSLEDLLGGQLAAGFVLTDLYEDRWPRPGLNLAEHIAEYMATRALKPHQEQP